MTKDRKGKGLLLGEGMTANLTLQSMDNHVRHGYLDPASEAKAMARASSSSATTSATSTTWPTLPTAA